MKIFGSKAAFLAASIALCSACQSAGPDYVAPPGPSTTYSGKVTLLSTSLPDEIGWFGGDVTVKVSTDTEDGKWSARLVAGETVGETLHFDTNDGIITVLPNFSDLSRTVRLEILSEAEWTGAASAVQEEGTISIGATKWARGNLSVSGGEFVIGGDRGMLFRHNCYYAVSSESTGYDGIAYTPEPVFLSWNQLPEVTGEDPCRKINPTNSWMSPSVCHFMDLLRHLDPQGEGGDLAGLSIAEGKLVFPASGYRAAGDGMLVGKQTNGLYWGRGADTEGNGVSLVFTEDDCNVEYHRNDDMGSIRCVRTEGMAQYAAHSPEGTVPADGFRLVVTAKGDKTDFTIAVKSDDNFSIEKDVTNSDPTAIFDIPANDSGQPRKIHIWIDHNYTGHSVEQAALEYLRYDSHSPEGTVQGDPFMLTVKCSTDMENFEVAAYTDDGSVNVSGKGSKQKSTVSLSIPANHSGSSRQLSIRVGDVDTGRSVTQEYRPAHYGEVVVNDMTWSRGNLVVRNGNFEIGEPDDYGIYFRRTSSYGIPSGYATYPGTAYTPEPLTIAWNDIPYNDGSDPCRKVLPVDTWMTPGMYSISELFLGDNSPSLLNGVPGYHFAGNELFIPAAGMIASESGTGVMKLQNEYCSIRPSDNDMIFYILGSEVKADGIPDDYGLPVRCVKRKYFADYVSHSPQSEGPSGGFTLTVVCKSDLDRFSVAVKGDGVDVSTEGTFSNATVLLTIPANESLADRALAIYIDDNDTGQRLVQSGREPRIEWSEGYLTVKDGKYVFADPEKKGLYFKHNSRYGVPGDATYGGVAYGPAATTLSEYIDIPYGDVDPCSIVDPANTWRIPSRDDFEMLVTHGSQTTGANAIYYRVGDQIFTFAGPSGSLIAANGKPALTSQLHIRTSTGDGTGNFHYYFRSSMDGSLPELDSKIGVGVGALVRCVRDR